MDKGVTVGIAKKFAESAPTWKEQGGVHGSGFRKALLVWITEQYGVTWSSACTHYNTAKKNFTAASEENKTLMLGLGRDEGKNNGGRKKKVAQAVEAAGAVVTALVEGCAGAVQELFAVKRKKDGEVVAEGLTFEAANEMIEAALKSKKAALYRV